MQPVAQHAPDAGVVLRKQEVIGIAEQMQLAWLAGALEQLHRLLGRCYRIVRRMDQQQRPRRNFCDHFVGAEVEHALRRLRRKRFDRTAGKIVAQVRRNRHDLVTWHHQRLAGSCAVLATVRQHLGKTRPFLRTFVLAAKFPLAVTPAAT